MTLIEFFSYAMASLPAPNANNFAFLVMLDVQKLLESDEAMDQRSRTRKLDQAMRDTYYKISAGLTQHEGGKVTGSG